MSNNLEIIKTGDGSHTIRDRLLDVTYHSLHGAITESTHVFIRHGLQHVYESGPSGISILEIGFGTGLNCLLSLQFSRQHGIDIQYSASEPYPLPSTIIDQLNYAQIISGCTSADLRRIHAQGSANWIEVDEHFRLQLRHQPFEQWYSSEKYDLVFLDAFGPKSAPVLWSEESIGKIRKSMKPGAVLVTFCAQGQFKRNLKSLDFRVEELPGPPGKREMVRARLI